MIDRKDQEGLAPTSSTPKVYTFEEVFSYFDYILDLVKDEYSMNILTPEEFLDNDYD